MAQSNALATSNQPRTCQQTGLVLTPSSGQSLTRIQKVSWGPLNPPVREQGKDPASWGRYDVAGHRTVYGGTPAKAAYAESLAAQRISAKLKTLRLGDLFDDSDASDPRATLAAVTDEWDKLYGGMTPGKVVLGWRDARLEYSLTLPQSGWLGLLKVWLTPDL